jgi:hypothetical protein
MCLEEKTIAAPKQSSETLLTNPQKSNFFGIATVVIILYICMYDLQAKGLTLVKSGEAIAHST